MSENCSIMSLNTTKAGMEGLDKEKINKIIEEASKGSKFYEHKQKCQKRIDEKILELRKKKETFSAEDISSAEKKMDQLVQRLESSRNLSRTIIHIDMDAFYAAVEMRDAPELKEKPMAVGGEGMLSTSNYHARKYGVRAGMPGFIGRKLCPDLVIVPCNFKKYTDVSKLVQGVFVQFDKNFCMMSLDEGYLDLTDYLERISASSGQEACIEEVVNELRQKVVEATTLTCSAGIACNTRLAKIGSDQRKPDGQFRIPADYDEIMSFIRPLPIRKISGIGNVTEQLLNSLGIITCSDLFEKRALLYLLFSETSYHHFVEIALGLGCTDLNSYGTSERKSISTETTFKATSDLSEIEDTLEDLCEELGEDMKQKLLRGKLFTLKCKLDTFDTISRQTALYDYTNDSSAMLKAAKSLLAKEVIKSSRFCVRLLGVRMSDFYAGGDTKKQESIEKYLSGKQSELRCEECPVCFNEIPHKSANEFSTHVEKCLDMTSKGGEECFPSSSRPLLEPTVVKEMKKKEIAGGETRKETESESSRKRKAVSILDMLKRSKTETMVTCPVCNVWRVEANKVSQLNLHMDKCLLG